MASLRWTHSALIGTVLLASAPAWPEDIKPAATQGCAAITRGFSGMAALGHAQFLIAHDIKNGNPGARLAMLTMIVDEKVVCRYQEVAIDDWKDPDGPGNDLESICQVPGHPNEFLVAESQYYKRRFGRIFHVEITPSEQGWSGTIKGVLHLPSQADDEKTGLLRNVEGLACVRDAKDRLTLILGERGGKGSDNGLLCMGRTDLGTHTVDWDGCRHALPVSPPVSGPNRPLWRAISDLYLHDKEIWGVATWDGGDLGPFRSIVYPIARTITTPDGGIDLTPTTGIHYTVEGFKIEALSASEPGWSGFAVGTDDEQFGGVWRYIPEEEKAPTGDP